MVISHRSTRLGYILHATLVSTLNVVTKWEECIRSKCYICILVKPSSLLLCCKYVRLYLEELLPLALSENVHVVVADVEVDGVVAVSAADTVNELKSHYLGGLSEIPVVSLGSCKPRAVDTRLLPCAATGRLTAACISDGVGLSILERDERDSKVVLCALGEILSLGGNIREQLVVYNEFVSALRECDSVNLLALDLSGNIVGVDLVYVVVALFLALEYLKSLRLVTWSEISGRYLSVDYSFSRYVADFGQRDEITVAAHSVGAPGSCVSACKRGTLAAVVDPVDLCEGIGQRETDSGACR